MFIIRNINILEFSIALIRNALLNQLIKNILSNKIKAHLSSKSADFSHLIFKLSKCNIMVHVCDENLTEKNKPTNSSQNNKPLCNGFAKSFSNVFHESSISPPKQYSSCFAERTSVSDYASRNSEKSIHANYGLRSFQSADENTDRNNKQYR